MNSDNFNLLSRFCQMETVWEKGTYLSSYQSGNFTYILYEVEQFYVEEIRDTRSGFRFDYRGFNDMGTLERYLRSIDISGIYNKYAE